jgi:hypothetical protein
MTFALLFAMDKTTTKDFEEKGHPDKGAHILGETERMYCHLVVLEPTTSKGHRLPLLPITLLPSSAHDHHSAEVSSMSVMHCAWVARAETQGRRALTTFVGSQFSF